MKEYGDMVLKIRNIQGTALYLRIASFSADFINGEAIIDLSGYLGNRALTGLCTAISQSNSSIAITAACVSDNNITVKAKDISSIPAPYVGKTSLTLIYFLKDAS